MDKFDRYFKNCTLSHNKLINSYVIYKTDSNIYYLLSDGFSIIMTDEIKTSFTENKKQKESIINFFNKFIDKTNIKEVISCDFDYIKNNIIDDGKDKYFKIDDDFGLNFKLLKNIKSIIGCNKLNIVYKNNSYHPIIEIIGKGFQIGYLMPIRII